MKQKRGLLILLSGVLLAGLLGISDLSNAEEAEEILKKTRESSKEVKDMKADMIMAMQMLGGWIKSHSKVWQEGKRFRMETEMSLPGQPSGVKTIVVFDGETMWRYNPMLNVVSKLDFASLPKESKLKEQLEKQKPKSPFSTPPLGDYIVTEGEKEGKPYYFLETEDIFKIKELESNLSQEQKASFPIKKIVFWIDKENYLLSRLEFYSQEGNLGMWQEFRNIQINQGVSEGRFTFQIPEGAQVMDMAEMMQKMDRMSEEIPY